MDHGVFNTKIIYKYFIDYIDTIINIFAPTEEIEKYIQADLQRKDNKTDGSGNDGKRKES